MRRTAFNEPVFQPGDKFFDLWLDCFGEEPDREIARFIEEDDGCWTAEIMDNNERTAYVNDFTSEADLRAWLTQNRIEIEG